MQALRDTDTEVQEKPARKWLKGWHCSWENFDKSIAEIEKTMGLTNLLVWIACFLYKKNALPTSLSYIGQGNAVGQRLYHCVTSLHDAPGSKMTTHCFSLVRNNGLNLFIDLQRSNSMKSFLHT